MTLWALPSCSPGLIWSWCQVPPSIREQGGLEWLQDVFFLFSVFPGLFLHVFLSACTHRGAWTCFALWCPSKSEEETTSNRIVARLGFLFFCYCFVVLFLLCSPLTHIGFPLWFSSMQRFVWRFLHTTALNSHPSARLGYVAVCRFYIPVSGLLYNLHMCSKIKFSLFPFPCSLPKKKLVKDKA